MAKDQSKRIRPVVLAGDDAAFAAVQALTGYAPANPEFSVLALTTAHDEMVSAQTAESQAEAALATARDAATAKEWAYHNKIVGMRDSVAAQFGRDSDQVQAIGRKRASERKTPGRRTPATPTA
jgi:hypothetical protein